MSRRVGSYGAAILWIALNDDTEWVDDPNGSASVTLALVADIFGRSLDQATKDLRRTVTRERAGQTALSQARAYARRVLSEVQS